MPLYLNGTEGVSGINGTNSTPANRGSDTNTGIVYGTDTVQIATGGTTAVTVDSSQNVGIGTSSLASISGVSLQISNATQQTIRLTDGTNNTDLQCASGGAYLWNRANNILSFGTGNTERARIDSSGNLLVGTTSALGKLTVKAATNQNLAINGSTSITNSVVISGINDANNANIPLEFRYATACGFINNGTEAARVDTNGYLLVGYTSSNGAYKLQVNSQIFATSATIATSDARYKENVETITDGLELVNALNPVSFDWKQHTVHDFDLANKQVGFLAQEVQAAISDKPYLNSIIKANECELPDGTKEEFLGIAEGNMIAILTSAIKELSAKLDAAEARIAALEAK